MTSLCRDQKVSVADSNSYSPTYLVRSSLRWASTKPAIICCHLATIPGMALITKATAIAPATAPTRLTSTRPLALARVFNLPLPASSVPRHRKLPELRSLRQVWYRGPCAIPSGLRRFTYRCESISTFGGCQKHQPPGVPPRSACYRTLRDNTNQPIKPRSLWNRAATILTKTPMLRFHSRGECATDG